MNPTDDSLREHFRGQQRRDRALAPDFHKMAVRAWAAARVTPPRGFALPVRLVATMAALVVIGVCLIVRNAEKSKRGAPADLTQALIAANAALSHMPSDAPPLVQWSSPTAFLLDPPGALMWQPVAGPK